jgi:heme oxygenase
MTAVTVLRPRTDVGGGTEASDERVLDLLRYETRPHNIRLFRHERLTSFASRAEYVAILELLLGFYRPLDRWFATALGAHAAPLDLARRVKSPLLAHDLTVLGVKFNALRHHPTPLRTNPAYAMGWLYGVEVASLGAGQVARRARDLLGIDSESGGAFFRGYGATAPELWRDLSHTLTQKIVTDPARAAVLDGATDMLEALCDWLSLEALPVRATV